MAADPPPVQGSTLTRKYGPMPLWAWMLVGLGLALVYRSWQANKAAAAQQTPTTVDTTPPMVDQTFVTVNAPINTAPDEPPGQGRAEPPGPGPTPVPIPSPAPVPVRGPVKGAPTPAPAKPAGHYETVAKWTAKNTPWNSTIWGIATHFKIKNWQTVWNAPQNASLRARRKDPKLIQPGDRVFVPA